MSWEIRSRYNVTKATVDKVEYNDRWMQECYVTATIESPCPIDFEIGDYLIYRDERFEINYDPGKIKSAPRFEKGDAFRYENIKFNSLADELTRCDFLDVVLNDNQFHFTGLPKFTFYGNVRNLADRIQANLDRAYGKGTWQVVVAPEFTGSEGRNVSVDTIKVQGALSILVNDFKTYYTIRDRVITIGEAGIPAGHLFKYGQGSGLYEIEQNAETDQQIVTRLRAYGSTRNIPHRYYNSLTGADGKVLIPDNMAVQYLMLPDFPYVTQDPYIDSKNITLLGVREGTVFFDGSGELEEIYPSIEGMTAEQLKAAGVECSSTGPLDELVGAEQMTDNGVGKIEGDAMEGSVTTEADPATFKITVKDLGFDINEHMIQGTTPVVSFKSGMLGAREFEIVGCERQEDGTYVLELNRIYDDDLKLWFPYCDYNAKTGDRFVLLYIRMPEVYVKAAAQRLLKAAMEWLAKNDYSRSVFTPKIDEIFMARQHDAAMVSKGKIKSLHDTLRAGMQMLFEDDDLRIDAAIFIDSLTIVEGDGPVSTYEVVLKEEKTVGTLEKMQNQIDSLSAGQGQGGYNAAQIRNLIKTYGGQYFLSKIKADRTPFSLSVGGKLKAEAGAEFGEFLSGLFGGYGGAVDGKGNAEFESAVIRSALTVMELVINEMSVTQGDQLYSEGDTIDRCEPETDEDGNPVLNADGTQRWWIELRPRHDGYVTGIRPGMVLRGMVNNLYQASVGGAAGSYYTSWMRVNGLELGTQGNLLNVTLYPDDETPALRNYPPCELMTLGRWGHQTELEFQRLFKLSSHEGNFVRYEGVRKPIIDLGNIATFIGRYTGNWLDSVPSVQQNDEIVYAKNFIGNFIQTDHKGNPVPEYVYVGPYDPARAYLSDAWIIDSDTGVKRFVTEYTRHCGCLWLCAKNGVKGIAPGYGVTAWAFWQGNDTFEVDFEEKAVVYNLRQLDLFNATLTLTARMYNQDVLHHIKASGIEWTRESYDSNGALRAAADAAWTPVTDNDRKQLVLTKRDLGYDGTPISRITFTARVAIDDTHVEEVQMTFKKT